MTFSDTTWRPGGLGMFTEEELLAAYGARPELASANLDALDAEGLADVAYSGARSLVARGALGFMAADNVPGDDPDGDLDDDDAGPDDDLVIIGPLAVVMNIRAAATGVLVVDVMNVLATSTIVFRKSPDVPLVLAEEIIADGYRGFSLVEANGIAGFVLDRLGAIEAPSIESPEALPRADDGALDPSDLEWLDSAGGLAATVHVSVSADDGPDTLSFLVAADGTGWILGPDSAGAVLTPWELDAARRAIEACVETVR
jgi:hypothetical protein